MNTQIGFPNVLFGVGRQNFELCLIIMIAVVYTYAGALASNNYDHPDLGGPTHADFGGPAHALKSIIGTKTSRKFVESY